MIINKKSIPTKSISWHLQNNILFFLRFHYKRLAQLICSTTESIGFSHVYIVSTSSPIS